jgi:hypothetical protein
MSPFLAKYILAFIVASFGHYDNGQILRFMDFLNKEKIGRCPLFFF